jgi:N-acetylneuraminic acid mutarotase
MLVAITILGCTHGAAGQSSGAGGAFKTVAKLKSPRYGCAATLVDDNIYVLGGSAYYGSLVNQVERYNVLDNRVSKVTSKLIPRRYHAVESYDGKIYIIGGAHRFTGNAPWEELSNVECYDPATNEAKILAPMPTARKMPASVVHQGKIYVIGGSAIKPKSMGHEWYYDTVEIYDIATDTWKKGKDMLTPKQCEVVLKDGKIYAVGGYRGVALNDFEVYDIESDSWAKLPDLPFTLSAHHSAVLDEKIYCFGDYFDPDLVTEYDFKSGQWKILVTNFRPSRHSAVVNFGNTVFVLGGAVTSRAIPLDDIQRFRPPVL